MFNAQEQEIITAGRAAGKKPEEIEAAIRKYRAGWTPPEASAAPEIAKGIVKQAGSSVKATGDGLTDAVPRIISPALASIPGVREKLTGALDGFKNSLYTAVGLTDENLEARNEHQELGKKIGLAAELTTPFVAMRLARIAPGLVTASEKAAPKAPGIIQRAKDAVMPKNSPVQAVAQIGQGNTKTLSSVARTVQAIDTKGVKTYRDFQDRIDKKIPEIAGKVDAELAKDPKAYTLDELAVRETTRGGQEVSTDYVKRALADLKALYKATGDTKAEAEIGEIIDHAASNGLTRKEVNDISRVYGQEFGTKAFGKTGEPLTGTNAQAFETTRKGLKDVARQGLGGDEAKALDEQLSAMYDTRKLVEKNVEAVAKLDQRIQERGLAEKAGYYVSKYADILTGGTLRGFVGGILPRGAGYKTMNALDIEEALRKNLDIIEEALATQSDEELLKLLRKNGSPFKKATPEK